MLFNIFLMVWIFQISTLYFRLFSTNLEWEIKIWLKMFRYNPVSIKWAVNNNSILWRKMIPLNLLQLVNDHKAMNRRLLTYFALNEYQRFEAIFNLPLSGDMKPSKLMSSMLALLLPAYLILRSPLCPSMKPPKPASAVKFSIPPKKKSVRFLTQLETIIRWNPYRQIRERSPCSDLTSGGNDVKEDNPWVFWRTERGG